MRYPSRRSDPDAYPAARPARRAAQQFGQEDDVTVLTLEYAGAGVAQA
jgi:hypothetical protein